MLHRITGFILQIFVIICAGLPFLGYPEQWWNVVQVYAVISIIVYSTIISIIFLLNRTIGYSGSDTLIEYRKAQQLFKKSKKSRYFFMLITFPVLLATLVYSGSVVTAVLFLLLYVGVVKYAKRFAIKVV